MHFIVRNCIGALFCSPPALPHYPPPPNPALPPLTTALLSVTSALAPTLSSANPKYYNTKVDAGDEEVDGEQMLQLFRREVARAGVMEESRQAAPSHAVAKAAARNMGRVPIRLLAVSVSNCPHFTHRDILLDTARNYYPVVAARGTEP
ncbi:hypothetical protein ABZP36_030094 [Zizania latifolia]